MFNLLGGRSNRNDESDGNKNTEHHHHHDDVAVPPIPDPGRQFFMPSEEEPHEGTWLQWPHNYEGNKSRRLVERYQESWIQMVLALHTGEKVHIIVYNETELDRVHGILEKRGCDMKQIDFYDWPFEDVWIRDNGPIFVFDENNQLLVMDFGFNGWGKKYPYKNSNKIPQKVAKELNLSCVTVPMINEGGSVEIDGKGTLMAKKSSILNRNRNKGWRQQDAEAYFTRYLGVTNFIWLNGTKGQDITDDHIDGTARFSHDNVIVTFFREDYLDPREYDILANACNAKGEKFRLVHLPLTKRKIIKGEYGFYVNFYVGNEVVLMPGFDDPNDDVAADTLQALYPKRKVIKIPMTEAFKDGGMVHCVTQQQPQVT